MMRMSTAPGGCRDPGRSRLLDGAQQFRFAAHIHFRDFVEQERAAGRPRTPMRRATARKRTFLVAEHFGFQQMLGIAAQL